MLVGGWQKFSLLDYPEHISAIVFTRGCNFRCHFCYNPMLVRPGNEVGKFEDNVGAAMADNGSQEGHRSQGEDGLFAFLGSRVGKLDAVVVTGGEPTLQPDLPEFISRVKGLGFLVKLDTNGTDPAMLGRLLKAGLLDYVAMDIKGAPEKYDQAIGVQPDLAVLSESIGLLLSGTVPYEFRSTLVPGLHDAADIAAMGEFIRGAEKWFLQAFRSDTDLVNPLFKGRAPFTAREMEDLRKIAEEYVGYCGIR